MRRVCILLVPVGVIKVVRTSSALFSRPSPSSRVETPTGTSSPPPPVALYFRGLLSLASFFLHPALLSLVLPWEEEEERLLLLLPGSEEIQNAALICN